MPTRTKAKAKAKPKPKASTDTTTPAPAPGTAALLIIGDEILSGRTKDANLGYIAEWLVARGVTLREARVVPDEPDEIVAAINTLRARYAHVFTTGGIGPTHDDITADSVAAAFGVAINLRADAMAVLRSHYDNPADLNQARLRMARIPDGARLIDNLVSKAPGFQLGNVFVLPGVPRIMQAMLDGLEDRITGGAPTLSRTVTSDALEGDAAAGLAAIAARHPDVKIGSYPYMRIGRMGASFVARGTDAATLDVVEAEIRALVAELGATILDARPE